MTHEQINPDDLPSRVKLDLSYPIVQEPDMEVPFGQTVFYVRAYNSSGAFLLHGCATSVVEPGADSKVSIDLLWVCKPDGEEIPADGKDNDCDGMTDECINDTECKTDNTCQEGKCEDGECVFHDRTAAYPCSDGNPCSLDDKCLEGECVGGSWKDCSELDTACSRGVCNELSGTCTEQTSNDGSVCDDGLFCTIGKTCIDGQCAGEPNTCDDGEECTQDVCREEQGICDHILQPKPGLEGPFGDATCSDRLDNDCDGLTDDDDSGCSSVPVICSRDNWCWQNPMPQGNTLRDVWASSPDNVWAVGSIGAILKKDL